MKKVLLGILILASIQLKANDFPKLGKFELSLNEIKTCSFDSTASAVVLNKKSIYKVDYSESRGFNMQVAMFQRIKILSKEGLNSGNIILRVPKEVKLLKIKGITGNFEVGKGAWQNQNFEDKNLIKENFNAFIDILKIPMPGVREGSVLDVLLELEYPSIGYVPTFWFQDFIPVANAEITFTYPDFFLFKAQFTGTKPLLVSSKTRCKFSLIKTGSQ